MLYVGIDYHKRYSFVSIIDQAGELVLEHSINHRHPELFRDLFTRLAEPVSIVFESSPTWSWLYELLERIECVSAITLANPYKVRVIAETEIKTDKIDARTLARYLRSDMIPSSYIPDRQRRDRKEVLRQRAGWVKQRTAVRNRIHKLLGRQHELSLPQVSDLFGAKGMAALSKAQLPEPYGTLLRQNLEVLATLERQIRSAEQLIRQFSSQDDAIPPLRSIAGVGLILAAVIATETGPVERFGSAARYSCYAGLVPSTYSSGGKTWHGRMIRQCNKWLKWAFIEAAWVAVGCSTYFGGLYRFHRQRGKGANTAITIVARRMARISWQLLKHKRMYQERLYYPGRS